MSDCLNFILRCPVEVSDYIPSLLAESISQLLFDQRHINKTETNDPLWGPLKGRTFLFSYVIKPAESVVSLKYLIRTHF